MKGKILSTIVGVLVLAIASIAQTEESKCFEVVGTADFYFGTIHQDSSVTHTFVFKNNCTKDINIDRAAASCGCTAAILSEKVIKPGGEAKIEVKFTPPKGTRGKTTKTVSVYLKDQSQPHTVLRFSADVKTDLDIAPQYVQLLAAEVGKPSVSKATIKNVSDQVIEISNMELTMTTYAEATAGEAASQPYPLKDATFSPNKITLKPGDSQEITITVTPDRKGQVNGTLRFKTAKGDNFLQIFGIVRDKVEGEQRSEK